jgi:hypothetical protein
MGSDKKAAQKSGVYLAAAFLLVTAVLFFGCVSDGTGNRTGDTKNRPEESRQAEDSVKASSETSASAEQEKKIVFLPLDEAACINRETVLHQTYSAESAELETLPRGGKVYLKGIRRAENAVNYARSWYRVQAISGRDGWLEASAVSRFPIYGTIDPASDVAYVTETEEPLSPVLEGITGRRFVKITGISTSEYQLDGESGYTYLCELDSGPSGWVFEKDFSRFDYFFSRILRICGEPFPDFPLYTAMRETVREYFGEPESIESREVENVHYPEVTDTIYSFQYTGMNLHIYYAAKTEKEFVTFIETENEKVQLNTGLSPGMELETLISVLGPPHSTGETSYIYSNSITAPGQADTILFFFIQNGKVGRIEIEIEPL